MTVEELIGLLEDCAPEAEVRLAIQRRYPLEGGVAGVVTASDLDAVEDKDPEDGIADEDKVYIAIDVAGEYAPDVWKAIKDD